MSAAHARTHDTIAAPGNVVPLKRVEDADTDTWDPAELHPETAAQRFNPETQFVGALLWLTAEQARPILDLVQDRDIERPMTRWALELIRALVEAGQDPNPVLVIRAAEKQAPADYLAHYATRDWKPGGQGSRYHQLTLHIANVYDNAVGLSTGILAYAREVLDDSYRRAIRDHGIRMQQMADAMSDREDLTEYVTELMRGDLRDIWTRTANLDKLATA